jgi:predicted nucleic acid-binding Zn ribbon protein
MLIYVLRVEHINIVAAAATTTNALVFTGDQPCECEACAGRFRDCLHRQGFML